MIKVSATRQGEKTSTIPAVAGVKSGSGTGLNSGFDRVRNVGGVFRFGRWQLAKANCVYAPYFIKAICRSRWEPVSSRAFIPKELQGAENGSE